MYIISEKMELMLECVAFLTKGILCCQHKALMVKT